MFEIKRNDSGAVIAAKIFIPEIIQLALYLGVCAGGLVMGGVALERQGSEYSYFDSQEGARVGAFSGSLSYIVSAIVRSIHFCATHGMSEKDKELGSVAYTLLWLAQLGISAGFAAAGSKAFNYGEPGPASADQVVGNVIFSGAALIVAVIGASVYSCISSSSNRNTHHREPFSIYTLRDRVHYAEPPVAEPCVIGEEVHNEEPTVDTTGKASSAMFTIEVPAHSSIKMPDLQQEGQERSRSNGPV